MAEGVLPLAINRATRLVDRLADSRKSYYAVLKLGETTDTLDAEGAILERRPVPTVSPERVLELLSRFEGPQLQVPPAYSAIKVGGQRSYDLARQGRAPTLEARAVTIHRIDLLRRDFDTLALQVSCSKGTYVRSLARDVGEALGCGAHLARLVRTSVGGLTLRTAVSLEEIAQAAGDGALDELLIAPDEAIGSLPSVVVEARHEADMRQGRAWLAGSSDAGLEAWVYNPEGRCLGVASRIDSRTWRSRLALEGA